MASMLGKKARRSGLNRAQLRRSHHKVKTPQKVARMGWTRSHKTRAAMKTAGKL